MTIKKKKKASRPKLQGALAQESGNKKVFGQFDFNCQIQNPLPPVTQAWESV